MTALEAYQLYTALKLHLTTSYDFFKYKGKTKVSYSTLKKSGLEYLFKKVADRKDNQNFILANLIDRDPKTWPGELLRGPEAEECYIRWTKRDQSLTYSFTNELLAALEHVKCFDDLIITKEGEYPKLIQLYYERVITIDCVSIIEQTIGCFDHWDKKLKDDFFWPFFKNKIVKYRPFRPFDRKKIRNIILQNC